MSDLSRRSVGFASATALLLGCASTPPALQPLDRSIDVQRFMGDWYVLSSIPIDLPFFSEAEAHAAVETYEWKGDGEIGVVYRFRDGAFDGRERVLTQRAWVHDEERGTEWRIQFVWPFRSQYLIAWVDDDYRRAIVGEPSRRYVWLLSRDAFIPDEELEALTQRIEALGYDPTRLRRVPQREEGAAG